MNCCDGECAILESPERCPICSAAGTRVDPITLKALLTSDALRRGIPAAPRFCATESCPVVYFDRTANVTLPETDLTVAVHAKHPTDRRVPVCYCFGYSSFTIEQEIARNGSSTARATIAREVHEGHCACEVKNPKGSCCLGDIVRVEQRLRELAYAEG